MSANILKDKSDAFGDRIIACCHVLKERKAQPATVGQLLRAGTSVGANVAEAQFAQGKKDLVSKFEIALKEVNETEYWLERLYHGQYMTEREYKSMRSDCIAIRRLLIASVTTIKKNKIQKNTTNVFRKFRAANYHFREAELSFSRSEIIISAHRAE